MVVQQSQKFASIASLLYCLMMNSLMEMSSFTASLEVAHSQPNLFDSANLAVFLQDLKTRDFSSLLFVMTAVSLVEYNHTSTEEMISYVRIQ